MKGRAAGELVILALGGLGDMLLLSPFIRHFRGTGRYARIVCACPPSGRELFDRNPHLDRLAVCSGRELFFWGVPRDNQALFAPFHRVVLSSATDGAMRVELRERLNPARGRRYVLRQMAERAGVSLADARLELFTDASDGEAAAGLLAMADGGPVVLAGFRSALPEKDLPVPLRRRVRYRLRRAGVTLLEVEGRRLRIGSRRLPLPGLRVMAEVARRSAALLTVDSFLGHLAAAVRTPAVVLFGPSAPAVYGHPGNRNLRAGACRPCAGTARRKACTQNSCMAAFSAEAIADHVLALLRAG